MAIASFRYASMMYGIPVTFAHSSVSAARFSRSIRFDFPFARACHKLRKSDADFFGGAVNADCAKRHLVHFLSVFRFRLLVADEYFFLGVPVPEHGFRQAAGLAEYETLFPYYELDDRIHAMI